nr:hypothetical protein LTR18_009454 [Exophiala xenobiotica]
MADLDKRLQSTVATIEEILKLSSSAGASVGVAVNGKAVFKENFGFRDHCRSKRADSDTLYSIGSLTKSMTAAAAGIAVSQGSLKWESRICDILDNFRPSNRHLAENCTIADLLCHRSGLPGANTLWYQGGSEPLVAKKDIVPMINSMPANFDLRSSWGYSNWGFSLAGEVIEKATGEPWYELLCQNIWRPLGMHRTNTDPEWRNAENIAEGFSGLTNGEVFEVKSQVVDHCSIMGAAGGVVSSVNELLKYYSSLMHATQEDPAATSFKETSTLLSSHAVLHPPPFGLFTDTTYAFGLARTHLPARVGVISDNCGLVKEMPLMGTGSKPQVILYHSGTLSGFYASVYLLPETQSCVIVLVNTKPVCDSADWIAQALLQEVLNNELRHDFVQLAKESVQAQNSRYRQATETLKKDRVEGTSCRHLSAFVGRYVWNCAIYFVEIVEQCGNLELVIMGRHDQHYTLKHHHNDSFTWLMTDEEEAKRGRFIQSAQTYKIVFNANGRGEIIGLTWPAMGGMDGNFLKSNLQVAC